VPSSGTSRKYMNIVYDLIKLNLMQSHNFQNHFLILMIKLLIIHLLLLFFSSIDFFKV
jgi:hypothetical protein